MKNIIKILIFSATIILALIIALLVLSWPQLTGKTHILDTQPVDPFDLFRGQYLAINYEISRVSNLSDYGIVVSQDLVGKSIYVTLVKDSLGISRAESYSLSKQASKDFIKGKIRSVYGSSVFIEYGIEQYFFEKDAEFSTQNMTVEVKVSSSGRASISRLLQNNLPLNITYTQSIKK